MTEKRSRSDKEAVLANSLQPDKALRKLALEKAGSTGSGKEGPLSAEEAQRLLHELRVHQIELELQNEELRRTQAELAASSEKYFDLYDLAPVGYLTVARTGLITEANLTCANLLGAPRGDLVGKPLTNYIVPEDQDIYYKYRKSLVQAVTPQPCELRMLYSGEFPFWAQVESIDYPVGEKENRSSRVIVTDIARRKRAEEELRRLMANLEAANIELNEFAHAASHDLKSPLSGISMLTAMIVKDYQDKLDDEGRKRLNLIISRVRRMNNLIDGILEYSRIGRTEGKDRPVDVKGVVERTIDLIAPPAGVRVIVEDGLPELFGDATRVHQVFQNLIGNAVKFIDKPEGIVRVGCFREDGELRFFVKDNGPGIEERYHKKIFKMFQTLGIDSKSDSTGVGLAIVKRIVELYKGRVWIESKVGEGSTFLFTLPGCEPKTERP